MENPSQNPHVTPPAATTAADAAAGTRPARGYRPARQSRSSETERRVIAAAGELFAEHGFTHTRIAEIIRRAGVSTGSFYHRFADKEGLLQVMEARFAEKAQQAIDAWGAQATGHPDLRAMIHSLAARSYDLIEANKGIYRAVQEQAQIDPRYWQRFRGLVLALCQRVQAAMPAYRDEITAPDIEAATRNAVQLVVLVTIQTRLGAGVLFPTDRDAFLAVVVDAALGLLRPAGAG